MPAYTILFMRKDSTDRRPHTIHIGVKLFWFLLLTAIGLPILGFLVSFGILGPAWLKLDFENMKQSVDEAKQSIQPLQQQNAELATKKQTLEQQLQAEREGRAKAETEVTMSRTARAEAASRMAEMEGELITLKKSLATYEKLLKPKLEREMVQCVDLSAAYANGQVTYKSNFAKVSKNMNVPNGLIARVRVLSGDNAVAMEQGQAGGAVVNHNLDLSRTSSLKGQIPLAASVAEGTTRLLDIKVFDGAKPIGYCWKAF
jgi:hypothetical protein